MINTSVHMFSIIIVLLLSRFSKFSIIRILVFLRHFSNNDMDEFPGTVGTTASLALRLGQVVFSIGSLLFMRMDVHFYNVISFCLLATVMGLMTSWSLTLATVDAISVVVRPQAHHSGLIAVIVVGDWVLSFLSLAASCSTASVLDFLIHSRTLTCDGYVCLQYQLSAVMAFFAWFLTFASALLNLWHLPSM
ncbi:CASP-like protein ARALYDRAFT_485429 isoform X1 [Capsicum annuum]|uniref:CASP-like protein ARALYDRAFT_485429 isoform X1 n=1 Tax=Capsicum annuum TaxID=4072 RepID=UPI0007BF8DA1|nr:CASP-like protein ARALYDRAFT_485429 isoform X1 [Capsicum annuum]